MKKLYVNPAVKFVTVLFLLFSCNKVDEYQREARPSYLTLSSSADARLQPLIDSIWHYERHRPAIGSIISKFGSISWVNGLIGYRGKTLVAVIPLCDSSRVSGFIAFEMDERIRFRFYDASRSSRSRSVANVINALNFKVFGISLARIDDPQAMSRREAELFSQARSADPSRSIYLNVRMVEATTCYSWVSCIGDGNGNCVSNVTYHSECVTSVVWVPDWYFEEPWDYRAESGLGGGDSEPYGGDEGVEAFVVYEPERPIDDVGEYLRCFSTAKGAKVTFYADQPNNGSAIKFSKYEKAGHAFVGIEQNINNTIVRRVVGFYPEEAVDPVFVTSGSSILGDNSNDIYDVKLTVDITGLQLGKILNIIKNFNPVYDLQKYNCTNFVLDISDALDLSIKRTTASWGLGSGLNPTNFGEDLKDIQGVTIGTGNAPGNTGDCH